MIMLIALFGIAHSDIEESSYTKPHNFGMGIGYGFSPVILSYEYPYSYIERQTSATDINHSVSILGTYQFRFGEDSRYFSAIEVLVGLGANFLNPNGGGVYPGVAFDMALLYGSYYMLNGVNIGLKSGGGYALNTAYNSQELQRGLTMKQDILYHSYGALFNLEAEIAHHFALGIMYGYYFGVHISDSIELRSGGESIPYLDSSVSTWSLLGSGTMLTSHKLVVYAMYRF